MSCQECGCDCRDHYEDEDEEDPYSEDYGDDEETGPNQPLRVNPPLPPPPPSPAILPLQEQKKLWKEAIDAVFDEYPGARINMPALSTMVVVKLGYGVTEFQMYNQGVKDYIHELANDPIPYLTITKGRLGGISRIQTPAERGSEQDNRRINQIDNAIASAKAINNHTCVSCGNPKCNTNEPSCWKCGHPIQG
jgi:hypothetical protein